MKPVSLFYRINKLLGLAVLGLSLTACADDISLLFNDIPNTLFDANCGSYQVNGKAARERCGNAWDSFGYFYEEDKIVRILLQPGDDSITDYNPTFTVNFDTRHLKEGKTLSKKDVFAQCSRFKPELKTGDPTYYTNSAASFSWKIEEDKGIKSHSVLGDEAQWVFSWKIECPALEMKAEGKDQINLDFKKGRNRWEADVGDERPPVFEG